MASSNSSLSALQTRVLDAFRGVAASWLTGGAALGGFHTHHRRSRDLDFFTSELERLDELARRLEQWCSRASVSCELRQSYPGFRRYFVSDGTEETLVDLVHELVPQVVEVPDKPVVDGLRIDPLREIRANKIAALLGRAETKDLLDLFVLEAKGWPALDGLTDAQRKDGGLDASTLAWVLSSLRVDLEGLLLEDAFTEAELEAFKQRLIDALQRKSWPGP